MENKKTYNKILATVKHELIEAALNGLYRLQLFEDAKNKLLELKEKFVISKEQPFLLDEQNPAIKIWIKSFEVTKEQKEKGAIGNFALIKVTKINNKFSLIGEKIEVEIKLHPQKINKDLLHPNAHNNFLLREIFAKKTYDELEKANAILEKLHTNFPKVSIPGLNKLRIITYNSKKNPPLERIIIEIKVAKEGGFYFEVIENKFKRDEKKPKQPIPTEKTNELQYDVEIKKGYFTSLVELKKKPKK